ncbi:MAG: bifunctional riboflavin kinase/FAD synthetase [Bacteroidota bacterium]
MKIFYGTENLPELKKAVLTIGTFDGVHQGHKKILQSVVHEALAIEGTSVLITFNPHPRKLLFPGESLKLLSTLDERLDLVREAGIDVTVVVPFTHEFAGLSAQSYIEEFLIKIFNPALIIIGYDHHFGHDRTGDISMLRSYSGKYAFEVKEISAQLISEAAVSSTQIRKALVEGSVEVARKMLGTSYRIKGRVVEGAQRGRTIGFPTANIALPDADKLVPKVGVYAVEVVVREIHYGGMINIGYNPTVTKDDSLKIEVHIFDFDADIYGQDITIGFIARLRDEYKFDSLEGLKMQLNQDKANALLALNTHF